MFDLWLILDRATILLALLASGYSAFGWWRHHRSERRLQQPVPIRLISKEDGSLLYELPYRPPRRLITRAEVLGILGMIPSAEAGRRFEWAWLHQPKFMEDLEAIHHSRQHCLSIPLSASEVAQLALPKRA